MVRIAKQIDPKKIAELKKKIHDTGYLDMAIQKLALTLTKEISVLRGEEK